MTATAREAKSNLLVVCIGGCGSNALRAATMQYDPEANPYLSFLGVESNRKVLQTCLTPPAAGDAGYLLKWLERKEQLQTIQLGELGLGAGGNIAQGEEMAREKINEIKEYLARFDNAVLVGGGGGGTCGAMPIIAEALRELEIPAYAILTMPRIKEGPAKTAKAKQVRDRMLELCPTTLIANECIPDKTLPYSKVWHEINRGSLFWILGLLRSLLQEVGDVRDLDGSDWKSGISVGNYTIPGFYDASNGLDGLARGLLGNPYLDARIIERARHVVLWFEGNWPVQDHDKVIDCIQDRMDMHHAEDIEFKYGIKEAGIPEGVMTVGFVAFAKEGPKPDERTESIAAIQEPLMAPHAAQRHGDGGGNGKGNYVSFSATVNQTQVWAEAPQEVVARYRALFTKPASLALWNEAKEVQELLRQCTGLTIDVPTRPPERMATIFQGGNQ